MKKIIQYQKINKSNSQRGKANSAVAWRRRSSGFRGNNVVEKEEMKCFGGGVEEVEEGCFNNEGGVVKEGEDE